MKALRLIGKALKALRYPALAVVLLFTLSIIWIMYFVKDIPPVNDKDLRTRPPAISKEENAWPVLMQSQTPYKIAQKTNMNDLDLGLYDYARRCAAMDRAAKHSRSQGQFLNSPGDRIPVYLSFRDLVRVRMFFLDDAWRTGKRAQAQKELRNIFESARILEAPDGGGTLISTMIALSIRNMALEKLNQWAGSGKMSAEDMIAWTKYLASQHVSAKGFQNVWRNEFVPETVAIDDIGKGDISKMKYLLYGDVKITGNESLDEFLIRLAFRPERARKRLVAQYEDWIYNATVPYSKMKPTYYPLVYIYSFYSIKRLFQGELGADIHYAVRTPNFLRVFARRCAIDFLVDATRVRLASMLYKKDHGDFPTSLDALVPKYLDAVPADPFDGKPLRDNFRRGLVYSVGHNLKDDHARGKPVFTNAYQYSKIIDQPDIVMQLK